MVMMRMVNMSLLLYNSNGFMRIRITTFLCIVLMQCCKGEFDPGKFRDVTEKMETDVKELALEIQDLYAKRCSSSADVLCEYNNYDHCISQLPNPTCPGGASYNISECGDGVSCGGLFDFTTSSIRILKNETTGPEQNPVNLQLIESICFTQPLDEWFRWKHMNDTEYWTELGIAPRSMYFGSFTGSFRIYPARPSRDCDFYDPRIRPWYVSASSGPKNIVLVLDTSGSMENGDRIGQLQWAAQRVVQTLTTRDTIAIVLFNTNARAINVETNSSNATLTQLVTATDENKKVLIQLLSNIQADGFTNFQDAFTLAFDIIDDSILNHESHVECTTAILFLTDGVMTIPSDTGSEGERQIIDLVNNRTQHAKERLENRTILLFTYSVAGVESDVHKFPEKLACSVENGLWSKISEEEEIVDSLSSYYKLFSVGLGTSDFAAWVKPYPFATGNILGTTVSVPVYDRDSDPPIFLGVVGIDVAWEPLIRALGGNVEDEVVQNELNILLLRSTEECPPWQLGECEIESYRRHRGSNCTLTCGTEIAPVDHPPCTGIKHATFLWNNTHQIDTQSYEARTCCRVDNAETTEQCSATNSVLPQDAIQLASRPPATDRTGSSITSVSSVYGWAPPYTFLHYHFLLTATLCQVFFW